MLVQERGEGSQASTYTRASYSTADGEQDRNNSPSYEPQSVARNVSRQEVGTQITLQIVRNLGVTFSGKRDSSAAEFLTIVRKFRRGGPLLDEEMLEALPFLLTDRALKLHRLHEDTFASWPTATIRIMIAFIFPASSNFHHATVTD